MPWFNGQNRPRADFRPVTREPSGRELADEARIAELDEQAFIYHRRGERGLADACLDKRNAIRPARAAEVPYNPGGPVR